VDGALGAEPLLSHIEDPLVRVSFLNHLAYALGTAARYKEASSSQASSGGSGTVSPRLRPADRHRNPGVSEARARRIYGGDDADRKV
jgi:hypothetical protein